MVCFRSIYVVLVVSLVGCQRLPDDGPTTSGGQGTGGTGGGTFLPAEGSGGETGGGGGDGGGDGGGMSTCNPVTQDGCNDGERCTATGSSGTSATFGCVPDNGGLGPYDSCMPMGGGIDGCPAGYACIVDSNSMGSCLPLCNNSGDCDLGVCLSATVGGAPYCADDCSPFDNMCPAPTQCRRNGERFSCRVPQESDVGADGSPCMTLDDSGCTSGYICVVGELVPDCTEPNCCASLCEIGDPSACTNPSTCNPALEAPAPGFDNIGACFVPA